MARVFTASLLPSSRGHGETFVTVRNLLGEDLSTFQIRGETMQDLEDELSNLRGPMFSHLARFGRPMLRFFTLEQPSQPLDMQVRLDSLGPELVIKEGGVEACLEKFPDTGKFLEAMRDSKFDPNSELFDRTWRAKTAKEVPVQEAVQLVQAVLGETADSDSQSHFVRIFGQLTTWAESWTMFDLGILQNFDLGLRTYKHCLCQHWLELARAAATPMVSGDVPSIALIKLDKRGKLIGLHYLGDSYPSSFGRNLQQSLRPGVKPSWKWENVSRALLSLDWAFHPEEVLPFEASHQEPDDFASLQPYEVLQMVHVQLRLSFYRLAEVAGSINEVCAKLLADLLRYKLEILKFQSETELKAELSGIEAGEDHRGTLILVTGVPSTSRGNVIAGPHRLVLCYDSDAEK